MQPLAHYVHAIRQGHSGIVRQSTSTDCQHDAWGNWQETLTVFRFADGTVLRCTIEEEQAASTADVPQPQVTCPDTAITWEVLECVGNIRPRRIGFASHCREAFWLACQLREAPPPLT